MGTGRTYDPHLIIYLDLKTLRMELYLFASIIIGFITILNKFHKLLLSTIHLLLL